LLGHLDGMVANLLGRYRIGSTFKPKRFLAAYWASKDDLRFKSYAYDLDKVDAAGARKHLIENEGWSSADVAGLTDQQAQSNFRRLVRRHVVQLERDLEPAS